MSQPQDQAHPPDSWRGDFGADEALPCPPCRHPVSEHDALGCKACRCGMVPSEVIDRAKHRATQYRSAA